MAKNNDDDWNFDDLDDLDFGFDTDPESGSGDPNSRNPINDTAKLVVKSMKDTIVPRSQRDRIILDALPETATPSYEAYQDINSAVADVYSHTKEELEKTQRTLKIQTRQLLPTMKKYLPESITSRVDAWSKVDRFGANNYDPNQAILERTLSDVFGQAQQPQQPMPLTQEEKKEKAEEAVKQEYKETVQNLKSDKLLEVAIDISRNVTAQTTMQNSVTINWQRKSLEYQIRQLFALQEIAKLSNQRFERDTPALEAIVKNTALPDYAKEEFGEIQGAMFKRQIAEWISPARYTEDFITRLQDNMKKKVSEMLGEGRSLVDLIAGGLVEEDEFDLEDNSAISPDKQKSNLRDKGTKTAVSWLTHKFINPQRDKLTGKMREKLEDNPEVAKFFNDLQYTMTNLPTIANSAMSDERSSGLGNFFKALNEYGIAPDYRRESIKLETRDGEYLDKAAKNDNRSYITLNEVIPAWLAKINTSIRAGYGEFSDEVYDMQSRSFVDRMVVANRVRESVGADDQRERIRKRIGDVVGLIDPNGELNTKEDRDGLSKFIESRLSEAKEFNVKALVDDISPLLRYMSFESADKLKSVLEKQGGDDLHAVSNKINNELRPMRSSIGSYQAKLNQAKALYGEKAVIDSGIIDYDSEKDELVVDKTLTDINKNVGKVNNKLLTPEQQLIMRRRALASQHAPESSSKKIRAMRRGHGTSLEAADHHFTSRGISVPELRGLLYGSDDKANFVNLLSKEDQETPRFDADRIVDAIVSISTVSQADEILKHVKAMDEEGVLIVTGTSTVDEDSNKGRKFKKGKRRRVRIDDDRGLLRRWGSLGADTAGSIWDGGIKFGGRVKNGFTRARKAVGISNDRLLAAAKAPFTFGFDAIKSAGNGASSFVKGVTGAQDIYDASGKVVLSARKMRDGAYFKKEGEKGNLVPLLTLDDIKGATEILDKDGNVVLSSEELARAGELSMYKDKRWWRITEVIGGNLGGGINKLLKLPTRIMGENPVVKMARWAMNFPDMYVDGKLVLRSQWVKEGMYFCEGKPIRNPSDIKGEVVDRDGKVIISQDDFKREDFKITDRWGREVKTPLGRVAARITGAFSRATSFVMNTPRRLKILRRKVARTRAAKFIKRNTWGRVKGLFVGGDDELKKKDGSGGGWFSNNFSGNGFGYGRKATNQILIRIYKLLNARMEGEPESESWISETGVESSGAFGKNVGKLKKKLGERLKKLNINPVRRLKVSGKLLKRRLNLKGKFAKLKPKNAKAAITERFNKLTGKYGLDDDKNRLEILSKHGGASAAFYAERLKEDIDDRELGLIARGKKRMSRENLMSKFNKVKDSDRVKDGLDVIRAKRKIAERKARNSRSYDFVTGDDKSINRVGRTLIGADELGTRGVYRDKIVSELSRRRQESDERMNRGIRGKVNQWLSGKPVPKDGEKKSLSERMKSGKEKVQNRILEKLTEMNEASQGMWFNTMRTSAEQEGMPRTGVRGLLDKFGAKFKFGDKSAGKSWFGFLKRGGSNAEVTEGIDPNTGMAKKGGDKKKSRWPWLPLLLGGVGALFGGLPGAIAGALSPILLKLAGKAALSLTTKAVTALATSGVVTGAVSAAGGAIATAATAAAGFVSLPVVATVAAVGAIGWGVYKLATRKRAFLLDKMRLAQYGEHDYDLWSTDESARILYLEDNLKKFITYTENGQAICRGVSGQVMYDLSKGYGCDVESKEEIKAFETYLIKRFIPVFLNWSAAIRGLESNPSLKDVGNSSIVTKKDMKTIWNKTVLKEDSPIFTTDLDPTKADRGWFKSFTDWAGLTTKTFLPTEDVMEIQKEVLNGIEKLSGKDGGTRKSKRGVETVKTDDTVAAKFNKLDGEIAKAKKLNRDVEILKKKDPDGILTGKQLKEVTVPFDPAHVTDEKADVKSLSALQAVRMKVYGASKMNPTDVKTILKLESLVLPDMDKRTGTYKGDMESALSIFAMENGSKEHGELRMWFIHRFIPALATYMLAMKRYLPTADVLNPVMAGQYLFEIAKLLIEAKTNINGSLTPLWFVPYYPYGRANDDAGSCRQELETLKKLADNTELNIDNIVKIDDKDIGKDKYTQDDIRKYQQERMEMNFKARMKTSGGQSAANDSIYNNTPSADGGYSYPGDGKDYSDSWKSSFGVSNTEADPGEGTYKAIKEKTQGKDVLTLIQETAKAMGLDPMLMASMAQIESSLNPKAKAKTSTAAGLYQFLDGTWKDMIRGHANKYGVPAHANQYDPVASAIMGGAFLKDNGKGVKRVLNRPLQATDYYLAHFLGQGGARTFLSKMQNDPNAPAARDMPDPAKANASIFYKGRRPRSYGEIYELFSNKLNKAKSVVSKASPKLANLPENPAQGVVQNSNDLPAANDARREDVVKAKADRDAASLMPKGGMGVANPTGVPKDVNRGNSYEGQPAVPAAPAAAKAQSFAQNTPNITEDDKAVYAEQMAKNVAKPPQASNETPVRTDSQTNAILTTQLSVQEAMANELVNIRKLLTAMMNNAPGGMSREQEQLNRDVNRQPPKRTYEHGESLINTKRVSNM